ncbi:hypothetical protein B4Q13_25560, partial [Lacticaseibacillus rhamnosus]
QQELDQAQSAEQRKQGIRNMADTVERETSVSVETAAKSAQPPCNRPARPTAPRVDHYPHPL